MVNLLVIAAIAWSSTSTPIADTQKRTPPAMARHRVGAGLTVEQRDWFARAVKRILPGD